MHTYCFILWIFLAIHLILAIFDVMDGFFICFGVKNEVYMLLRDFEGSLKDMDEKCMMGTSKNAWM